MKKLVKIAFLFIAALTLSCSSDSDSGSGSMYIKFKANGTAYNLKDPATVTSLIGSIGAYQGDLMGDSYIGMNLSMPVVPTVGVHQLVPDSFETDIYTAEFSKGQDIFAESTTGTINITSIEGEIIKGTFSFTGTFDGVTYNVTEGEFKAYKPE